MREEKLTWMAEELDRICGVLKRNMERYGTDFPSACATGGKYRIKKNDDWTNGFWTGMLWMAYLHTGDEAFKTLALKNTDSFKQRLDDHFVLDHHDIGFLYSPSVVAAYRITGDEGQRDLAVRAADVLAARFQEKGGFIQAWGKSGDPKEYRLIIDSLLNLPLLYTAAEITGEARYREMAQRHYENVIRLIIREDGSTYHTYYFDSETGAPSRGATATIPAGPGGRPGPFTACRCTSGFPAGPLHRRSRSATTGWCGISWSICPQAACPIGIWCSRTRTASSGTARHWPWRPAACWRWAAGRWRRRC